MKDQRSVKLYYDALGVFTGKDYAFERGVIAAAEMDANADITQLKTIDSRVSALAEEARQGKNVEAIAPFEPSTAHLKQFLTRNGFEEEQANAVIATASEAYQTLKITDEYQFYLNPEVHSRAGAVAGAIAGGIHGGIPGAIAGAALGSAAASRVGIDAVSSAAAAFALDSGLFGVSQASGHIGEALITERFTNSYAKVSDLIKQDTMAGAALGAGIGFQAGSDHGVAGRVIGSVVGGVAGGASGASVSALKGITNTLVSQATGATPSSLKRDGALDNIKKISERNKPGSTGGRGR